MAAPQAQTWHDWSIYVLLGWRGDHSTFHLGLVVTKAVPDAHYWHANNPVGPNNPDGFFFATSRNTEAVLASANVVMAYKLGTIGPQGWGLCYDVLMEQLNELNAKLPTGGPHVTYRCRTFVLEAIRALHFRGVLQLEKSVGEIEAHFDYLGHQYLTTFVHGTTRAQIRNDTNASTTA